MHEPTEALEEIKEAESKKQINAVHAAALAETEKGAPKWARDLAQAIALMVEMD